MSGPRKSKAAADGGEPETDLSQTADDVAAEPVVAAPVAAPAPEATVPPPPATTPPPIAATAPPPAPPAAPAAPAGPPAGAQVAAAISGVASTLKEKLTGPELLLGAGSLLIVGLSFLVLDFLLGTTGPSEGAVIVSVLLLGLIGLERTNTEGFGSWYKVLLVLLGAILLLGAAYSFLFTLRHQASYLTGLDWLSMIVWWAGGVVAGVGSWMTYRVRV